MATTQESKESKLDVLKEKFQSQLDDARTKFDEMPALRRKPCSKPSRPGSTSRRRPREIL